MSNFVLPSLPQKRYSTIAETSKFCKVPATTLRYWEQKFPMLKPRVRTGRRYYRQEDIALILKIKHLLQGLSMSINDALLQFSSATTHPGKPRVGLAHKSSKAKKLYSDTKRKQMCTGLYYLDPEHGFSPHNITKVCRVSERTAQRYLKAQKAPYAVCRLLELESRGRILPDSWQYCFVNAKGNLEINQVGEVSENEIVNIRWLNGRISGLSRELCASQARVTELERLLALEQARQGAQENHANPITDHGIIRSYTVKNPSLYSAKRQFEVVIQAFQGLEEIASRSEGSAASVGNAMVPIIYQAIEGLKELDAVYEQSKIEKSTAASSVPPTGQSLVLLSFPGTRAEQ